MPTLAEIRDKYPQYSDLTDQQLADSLYERHYSDMPRADFDASIGLKPEYSGAVLPFSRDTQGNVSFDPGAGILGSIGRAFSLPGEVYRGEVNPNSQEGVERAAEMGLMVTPANPAVRSFPGSGGTAAQTPTWQELRAAGRAGFDRARDMGVHYAPQAVQSLAASIRSQLVLDGLFPNLAPKAYKILDDLQTAPAVSGEVVGVTAPLAGIEAARRGLRAAGKDFANPTEQEVARRISQGLDEFVQSANPETVVSGPASAAARVERDARANYAAGSRSKRLNNLEESAQLRADSANSGQNFENLIRRRAADIVDPTKPHLAAGFSPAELALIRKVAEGTAVGNTLRFVGNLLGGGGGMGANASFGTAGGAAFLLSGGNPFIAGAAGVAAPTTGWAMKKAAAAGARRHFRDADEAVRQRSPLYQDRLRNAPRLPDSTAPMSAIPRFSGAAAINQTQPTWAPMTIEELLEFQRRGGA